MRALTQEEYEVLSTSFDGRVSGPEGARMQAVCDRLVKRGCYTLNVSVTDGLTHYAYRHTPLGLLALRVSRPEMAMRLP